MPVNLSIKNVPDDIAQCLKDRAARHHRSLNGELLTILEEAARPRRALTIEEASEKIRRLRLNSPSEAVKLIREDRDSR